MRFPHNGGMKPASDIIQKCGGDQIVAAWLGLHRTRVLRFRRPKEAGGTGGLIPARHQSRLLSEAQRHGIDLRPSDFFADHDEEAA